MNHESRLERNWEEIPKHLTGNHESPNPKPLLVTLDPVS